MPRKRKLGLDETSDEGSNKKRKIDVTEICQELYDIIRNHKIDGRLICETFIRTPKRRNQADYYDVVQAPIDLSRIQQKIKFEEYEDVDQLTVDIELLVNNAKNYFKPESQEYQDACDLWILYNDSKSELLGGDNLPDDSSSTINVGDCDSFSNQGGESSIEEDSPLEELFASVMTATVDDGRSLCTMFQLLPSKTKYPDYYQEIKHPMSLSKIKSKIKMRFYRSTVEVVDDLNTMFENAKKYNRPDSKIFKDACKLQKIMQAKAKELVNYQGKESDSSDTDNEDSSSGVGRGRGRKPKTLTNALNHELKRARRTNSDFDPGLRKRMKLIIKTLINYVDDQDRQICELFMEKPSKKDYPDYYEIIENPIDMKTIQVNVRSDQYATEDAFIADLKQMFDNCKQYNEEGSQIYRDAETLEALLNGKLAELGAYIPKVRRSRKSTNLIQPKLKVLYDAIINYNDPKTGRQLSSIFMKLPSRLDYPDYYDVIKSPLDLGKIGMRLKDNLYESLDDLLSDLVLVFDNACKYNEPDSQLYKDALTLQHVALQTKLELIENESQGVPNIRAVIQDLLTNLFISVYNHQDEEGRCYSDSIIELSEQEAKNADPNERRPLTLDQIKKNLEKRRYRRLDRFQQDMFDVFERTRRSSRSDSQAFEDSVELQLYFIRLRNELCRNGEVLQSSALNFTETNLNTQVDALKSQKLPFENQEAEAESKAEDKDADPSGGTSAESIAEVSLNDQVYRPGDFVYIEPREKGMDPHIINISKLWKDPTGQIWIYGCWFYRPYETYHIASKKFLEKEVFKSDSYNNALLSQVVGKCFIMFVKDYFKQKPEGFDDRDVYVCESRYFTRTKTFKKIKVWLYFNNHSLIPRETHSPMIRVPSIFKNGKQDKSKDEQPTTNVNEYDDDDGPKLLDIERPNIIIEPGDGLPIEEGAIYYEQFTIPSGSYKLGDCCYVRTDNGRNLICRIDRMWVDKDGNAFFHGPWFVQPRELHSATSRMFYPQEVFLSSIGDTNPLLSICDKCSVLEVKDYITRRPTEISEQDIYVCELKYHEHEKKFIKLPINLKRTTPFKPGVAEDEQFIFRKPLAISRSESIPTKSDLLLKKGQLANLNEVPSPLTSFRPSIDTENEESNDVSSIISETPIISTPFMSRKKGSKRIVTGYIIFAGEVRKSVIQANPDCGFGDVSRIIGNEWKNLPLETKQEYERRAQKQNEESAREAAREAERLELFSQSPMGFELVYECHWENKCDYQFEDPNDLYDHLNSEPHGHVWRSYGELKDKEDAVFQCLFHGCARVKKGATPFPSIYRLVRHCKEIHVNKQIPKHIPPENRSKNFIPGRKSSTAPSFSTSLNHFGNNNNRPFNQSATSVLGVNPVRSTPPPVLSLYDNIGGLSSVSLGINGHSNDSMSSYWGKNTQTNQQQQAQVTQADPLFALSPPKPTRLLHSSTFVQYIKRLRPDCRHVSNYEQQFNGTPENTILPNRDQLPTHWLANGEGNHGDVVNALWALRNFMLKESLNISRL
ncbi:protein polybromo-1-like isoform X2 [Panonychus citri]|uniref:protein polybromo-1-like isoform X2 n=1 Tax=Panonychus citri TaxID=50023 RepID=UPI00230774F3|nr:protein polybromo-1-like isoform X2 [Panonychus citri]